MLLRPNPSSGVPIYLQLMEQVKHSIETGALRPGEQLPGIRPLAEELVINPNTVAKAYRELAVKGLIDGQRGFGSFVILDDPVATLPEPKKKAMLTELYQRRFGVGRAWNTRDVRKRILPGGSESGQKSRQRRVKRPALQRFPLCVPTYRQDPVGLSADPKRWEMATGPHVACEMIARGRNNRIRIWN